MTESERVVDPFTFSDLVDATTTGGHMRFVWDGADTLRVCLDCDARFPQTDAGFEAMSAHEFEHGRGCLCPLSEIEGKALRMVVMRARDKRFGLEETNIWGVDDIGGVLYCLSHVTYTGKDIWKWKLTKPTNRSSGLKATRNGAALLSSFSESMAAK